MMGQQEVIKIFRNVKKLNMEHLNPEEKKTLCLSGTVKVEKTKNNRVIFYEMLHWKNGNKLLITSRNIYRWTFCESVDIKLEHLRFGKDNPVFLMELIYNGKNQWESKEPHNCNNDLYLAKLRIENGKLILSWNVTGLSENYYLETTYY